MTQNRHSISSTFTLQQRLFVSISLYFYFFCMFCM
nr:MAG TPA: hypothetical protein [Caudoviricetes sp.]